MARNKIISEKIIIDNAEAKNVKGSSHDRRAGSWIEKWTEETGRTPGKCSVLGCSNDGCYGGHLWIKNERSNNYYYIAPICPECNSDSSDKYRPMKANIAYLKINIPKKDNIACLSINAYQSFFE